MDLIDQLNVIFESGTKEELTNFCDTNNLEIRDGRVFHKDAAAIKERQSYWDKRQLVRKILLNSVYGASLNEHCRFFDERIGQSTTLTGRQITRHMCAKANELICGDYDFDGEYVTYGDTDSSYISVQPMLEKEGIDFDQESATAFFDQLSESVNDTFPGFMVKSFNVPLENGQIIQAGREVVGSAGLFITKKRYAIRVLDNEGDKCDKIKVMGMEIKRSDTPEYIQDFLEGILRDALVNNNEEAVIDAIKEFKKKFREMPDWRKGTPKTVKNLTAYTKKYMTLKGRGQAVDLTRINKTKKEEYSNNTIPGHTVAAIRWNELLDLYNDKHSTRLVDGSKITVCYLKKNPLGYDSVAYPVDQLQLPDWFKELPFDAEKMEEGIVDKKVKNVLGAMGWDLDKMNISEAANEFFDF